MPVVVVPGPRSTRTVDCILVNEKKYCERHDGPFPYGELALMLFLIMFWCGVTGWTIFKDLPAIWTVLAVTMPLWVGFLFSLFKAIT